MKNANRRRDLTTATVSGRSTAPYRKILTCGAKGNASLRRLVDDTHVYTYLTPMRGKPLVGNRFECSLFLQCFHSTFFPFVMKAVH